MRVPLTPVRVPVLIAIGCRRGQDSRPPGGGLIAGIASYVKSVRPSIQIIGVEPYEADAMYQSLGAGRRVVLDFVGIFADGIAVQEVGQIRFPIVQSTVQEIVRVSNDEICAAIKDIFDDTRSIMSRPARWRSPGCGPGSSGPAREARGSRRS